MRSLKKRGPHVLDDLNDLLFSLHYYSAYLGFPFLCYMIELRKDKFMERKLIFITF